MVLLEFSTSPFAKGASLSPWVARSLDIIDKSGLPYQLTPSRCRGASWRLDPTLWA